jgi:hypothetical protein
MSDQQETVQNSEREATLWRARDILEDALDANEIVVNRVNGSLDFDKGTLVVEHASVFESARERMLLKNVQRYGDRTAVFGPNLTNDEVETLKTYFHVATVARSKRELLKWACNLDRSEIRKVAESIEQVNDALKPAVSVVETIKAVKECLATALVVGVAGQEFFAKFAELNLVLQNTKSVLSDVFEISATGVFTPWLAMVQDPNKRGWFVGTVGKTLTEARAIFLKEKMLKGYEVPLSRRQRTREQGSSRREIRRIARH